MPLDSGPLVAAVMIAVVALTVALAVPFVVSRAFHMFTALPMAGATTVSRHAAGAHIDMLGKGDARRSDEHRDDHTRDWEGLHRWLHREEPDMNAPYGQSDP